MSRYFGGGDHNSSRRVQGLHAGLLDFDLDIGVVNDIDLDPLATIPGVLQVSSILGETFKNDSFEECACSTLAREPWLSIQGTEHGQSLFVDRQRIPLPSEWRNPDFPFVRGLPNGTILVSDTSFDAAHEQNTWILSRKGEVLSRFGIGSAAVEIAPLDGGLLAVAYHPDSAKRFGHRVEPQQRTAIGFFDHSGKLLSSFNHEAGRTGFAADNVRCMTRISPFEVVFVPERASLNGQPIENPVVFYNCASGRSLSVSAPFAGAEAVSVLRTNEGDLWVQLASPEGFEDQVIAFDPARKMSQYLGAFVGIFRGLAASSPAGLVGGFLAQEMAAEYQWVVADPSVIPKRGLSVHTEV